MAVFFLFLRNVLLPIEILKIKILEHSDPPSQHFSVHKAFSHFYFCRGKVMLCHLAEWHKFSDPENTGKSLTTNSVNFINSATVAPRVVTLAHTLHSDGA